MRQLIYRNLKKKSDYLGYSFSFNLEISGYPITLYIWTVCALAYCTQPPPVFAGAHELWQQAQRLC